ncbi:MAG: hypothetical protein JW908_15125 [Anaerolineales bacterium]|nr:hypothetical protein [Anaerolineales bacterium]
MKNIKEFRQAYLQTPWRKQMQVVGVFLLCLLIPTLVTSIYLNVTVRAAASGREILLMQDEIETYELENADLQTQLGIVTSAAEMEKKAEDLGFQRIQQGDALYLVVPGYTPRQSVTIAPPPKSIKTITIAMPPDFSQSLIDLVKQKIQIEALSTKGTAR